MQGQPVEVWNWGRLERRIDTKQEEAPRIHQLKVHLRYKASFRPPIISLTARACTGTQSCVYIPIDQYCSGPEELLFATPDEYDQDS